MSWPQAPLRRQRPNCSIRRRPRRFSSSRCRSIAITCWLVGLPRQGRRVLALGLALVLGGAIGNVIDRMLYGYVVDFILIHYQSWSYPAFNVADSAITCGVVLIVFDGIVLERRRARTSG